MDTSWDWCNRHAPKPQAKLKNGCPDLLHRIATAWNLWGLVMTEKIGRKRLVVSRRKILQATGCGIILSGLSRMPRAKAAGEKVTFQLDWIPFGRHAPYYVALDKGFY